MVYARLVLAMTLAALTACAAAAAAHYVPRERATECLRHCAGLDMRLSAVVVISNMVGCVCEPVQTHAGARSTGSAVAAGGAAIVAMRLQQQQQQQRQQQPVRR